MYDGHLTFRLATVRKQNAGVSGPRNQSRPKCCYNTNIHTRTHEAAQRLGMLCNVMNVTITKLIKQFVYLVFLVTFRDVKA